MTYRNLISQACASKEEYFMRMRDFICRRNGTYDYSALGIGWTLFDESYATDEDNPVIDDYYVIYSPGEGGKDDLYYKIKMLASDLDIDGYLSWDAVAHTGSAQYTAGNNNLDMISGFTLWVYGDLDTFGVVNLTSIIGDYDAFHAGKLVPNWPNQSGEIVNCAGALTAGSDVSITVDAMPTEWEVGSDIFIRTTHNDVMGTVKAEKITIKTLVGLVITADLSNSYTADSALSNHFIYALQASNYFFSTTYCLHGKAGGVWANLAMSPIWLAWTDQYFDPSEFEERTMLGKIHYQSTEGYHGYQRNIRRPVKVPAVSYTQDEDILQEDDGTEWRCFGVYSNSFVAFKEV